MPAPPENSDPLGKRTERPALQQREGGVTAPMRHAIDWQNPDFYNEGALFAELERVFDICHGCRRCFSLCQAFPTLFDLIDNSSTLELNGVDKQDYVKVTDQCYLCDLCYMTKCPYVPPHPWNVDFPHLMLRAKAVKFKHGKTSVRDKFLTSTDTIGKLAGIPVVVQMVNAANRNKTFRQAMDKVLGVHPDAKLPAYHQDTFRKGWEEAPLAEIAAVPTSHTRGKVVVFTTCFGNYNSPDLVKDLVAVYTHNGIPVTIVKQEHCCGMPKLELGDFAAIRRSKEANIPQLVRLVDAGWDIVAPVPSCVLMFKQELPLLFPAEPDVLKVRDAIYDPFEYLMLRHKQGKLNTDFKQALGKISYHVPCHQRVQNIGPKTRELLQLVPDTEIDTIERCSGHDGTYAVKSEFHEAAMKIGKPVFERVGNNQPDHYGSDCPIAGYQIQDGLNTDREPEHPLRLLRIAYGI